MADNSYGPKTYNKQGGDEIVIASGGALNVETGGVIKANGTQASAIVNLTDSSGGTANDTIQAVGGTYTQAEVANNFADLAAKVNAILNAIRGAGIIP
jgi:hypothetical protein